MVQYKFKVGDSFILPPNPSLSEPRFGQYLYVVSVTKEQMFALGLNIDSKGLATGDFQFLQFDFTKKEDLKLLTTINQNFPETKFGQIGSRVIYDEDEYVLFALKNVTFGTMSFIKPLLINTDKMLDVMEGDLQGADEFTDLQTTFNLNYPKFSKIPLESNKSLEIFEVAPPKFPVTTIAKIEIQEEQQEEASLDLIPMLKNTTFDRSGSYAYTVQSILRGFTLPFEEQTLYNGWLPYTILGEGKYRTELSTWVIRGSSRNSAIGRPVYIAQEGESLFPNWKVTTDTQYPIGTVLVKNGDSDTSVIFKLIQVMDVGDELDTKFGQYAVRTTEKGDKYINHPEIYLGGNKYFDSNWQDLFLLLGKQPLKGTKKDGIDSIWYKDIGSTQFPVKTRKQIDKAFDKLPMSINVQNNLDKYEDSRNMNPSTFFPKSFKNAIEIKDSGALVGKDFLNNRRSLNYSWEAFRLLSQNIGSQSGSKSRKSEIVDKLMEYFDYENLNIIRENNPKLYEKITDLMGKSIDVYIKNLPNKKVAFKGSESVEFLIMQLQNVQFFYRIDGNSKYYSNNDITDDDYLNGLNKFYNTLIDTFKENGYYRNSNEFLIPLNQFETVINTLMPFYRYAFQKGAVEGASEIRFEPNMWGEWYLSNFASAYDYSQMFNQYGDSFFPTFNIGEARYSYGGSKKLDYIFNGLKLYVEIKDEDYTAQNKSIFYEQSLKIHKLMCENFLVIKRFKQLLAFVEVFKYYEVVSKKVNVNFDDITNDIRFKYYLRTANIIGHFKESDFTTLLELFEQIREFALTTAPFAQFNTSGQFLDLTLDDTILDKGNPRENYKKLVEDGFNVNEYAQMATTIWDIILLEPKTVLQVYKKITDGMKENASFKALLEGTQTPQDMWLSLFGGGSSAVVIEDEEEVVEIESEGEPKVTVEEVEDVNLDDINWEEIDPEDIDIALSDEDFLEDNIEI